ncbi:hypothetical protein Ancab_035397 [Ancistrocladus abbreviatus]
MADVDWSQLPLELLISISEKVPIYSDYIRLRAVCLNWRAWLPTTPRHLPPQVPWLMLPPATNTTNNPYQSRRCFFDIINNKFHFLNLPEASPPRRVCCSSNGWLVILNENPEILCLNPLTRQKVYLPPLSSFSNVIKFDLYSVGREYTILDSYGNSYTKNLRQMRDFFVKKIVLSASPAVNDSDFVALAIANHTGELAFCKTGDHSWKSIEAPQFYCEDVIFFKGLFFGVDKLGKVAVLDVSDGNRAALIKIIETPAVINGDMQYLVSLEDDLLVASRRLEVQYDSEAYFVHKTARFEVHKLNRSGPRWETVRDLENCSLFLGQNSSLLFPSASNVRGCKGNCIYFTDDYSEYNYEDVRGNHDMGIYNFIDGTIEPLPCNPRSSKSTPIWVMPYPC